MKFSFNFPRSRYSMFFSPSLSLSITLNKQTYKQGEEISGKVFLSGEHSVTINKNECIGSVDYEYHDEETDRGRLFMQTVKRKFPSFKNSLPFTVQPNIEEYFLFSLDIQKIITQETVTNFLKQCIISKILLPHDTQTINESKKSLQSIRIVIRASYNTDQGHIVVPYAYKQREKSIDKSYKAVFLDGKTQTLDGNGGTKKSVNETGYNHQAMKL